MAWATFWAIFLQTHLVAVVDVMITIFCDFSAKKLAFFPKTNALIKFLQNLALF
jgi:hypothetical protein